MVPTTQLWVAASCSLRRIRLAGLPAVHTATNLCVPDSSELMSRKLKHVASEFQCHHATMTRTRLRLDLLELTEWPGTSLPLALQSGSAYADSEPTTKSLAHWHSQAISQLREGAANGRKDPQWQWQAELAADVSAYFVSIIMATLRGMVHFLLLTCAHSATLSHTSLSQTARHRDIGI